MYGKQSEKMTTHMREMRDARSLNLRTISFPASQLTSRAESKMAELNLSPTA